MDITTALGVLGIISLGFIASALRRRTMARPRPPVTHRIDEDPVAVAPGVTVTFANDVPTADRAEIADFFAWRFRNLEDD